MVSSGVFCWFSKGLIGLWVSTSSFLGGLPPYCRFERLKVDVH